MKAEQALEEEAREGRELEAALAAVAKFRPYIRAICRRRGLSHADTEEVQQDVALAFTRQYEQIKDTRAWIAACAKNLSSWKLRDAERAEQSVGLEAEELTVGPRGQERVLARDLARRLLARLSSEQRRALVAHVVYERSTKQLAGELGKSVGATAKLLYRARMRLRRAAAEGASTKRPR